MVQSRSNKKNQLLLSGVLAGSTVAGLAYLMLLDWSPQEAKVAQEISQPVSSVEPQHNVNSHSVSKPVISETAKQLYAANCQDCHDGDGTGTSSRADYAALPDFTSSEWQSSRTIAEIIASIEVGRGDKMPAFEGEFSNQELEDLAQLVRSFDTTWVPADEADSSAGGYLVKMQLLHDEMSDLRSQVEVIRSRVVID